MAVWGLASVAMSAHAYAASVSERDSIVVDGSRVRYLAEVDVDTTTQVNSILGDDWWLGVGWDIPWGGQGSSSELFTLGLVPNRPLVCVEHQKARSSGQGRLGTFLVYSQPWSFSQEDVSEDVKGWIRTTSRGASSPLQQVVLTPDSLAYERDTLMAPLSPGHALRVGLCWEGRAASGWWPRASVSLEVFKPQGWVLRAPLDPVTWPSTVSSDTFEKSGWAEGRFRLEVGGSLDVGKAGGLARTASQFRTSLFWVPGTFWGVSVALMASPTRR